MTHSTAVCCYCDTLLTCEGCGREQPDTPSTAAPTAAGALADEPSELLTNIRTASEIEQERLARKAALRNSAPQETRGGEPHWVKVLADNWRGRNGNTTTGDSVRNSCADELEKVAARNGFTAPQQSPRLEREGLKKAAESLEFIRLQLIGNLEEPERSAFWRAIEARNAILDRALKGLNDYHAHHPLTPKDNP